MKKLLSLVSLLAIVAFVAGCEKPAEEKAADAVTGAAGAVTNK